MLITLLIFCVVIWIPILFYHIERKGLLILLVWLFVAPIASNLVSKPYNNPFFPDVKVRESNSIRESAYLTGQDQIRFAQLLNPTHWLFSAFLVVFFLNTVIKKKHLLPLDRTEIWMSVFSLILLASVFLQSRRLAFGLRVAGDAFVVPFLAYFVARRLVTSEDSLRKLIQSVGYIGFYLIVIGFIERLTHHQSLFYRLQGPFGSTNALYVVMAVVFFLMLLDSPFGGDPLQEKRALPQGIRRFVLYLAPFIIFLNLTRGDWLGFFVGVGIFLSLGRRLINFSRKIGAIGLTLILITVMCISLPVLIPQDLLEKRIKNPATAYGRLATWERILSEAFKHPVFGIGLNNTRDLLAQKRVWLEGSASNTTVHNSFITIFTELGTVGLLVYLAMVVSMIRMGLSLYRRGVHRRDQWRGIAVVTIMVSYLVPALFGNTLHLTSISHIYVYVSVGGIASLYSRHQLASDVSDHRGNEAITGRAKPSSVGSL